MRSLMLTRQSESEVNGNFSKFQSKNMPDRIADEKKVVALMIRMYCRRHCRQQGRTARADLTNRTGRTTDINQADRTGNTNQADNSSRTDTSLLCPECAALLDYALRRLDSCRFGDGKPLPQMPGPLLPRRHEGAHTHGHALGRPENDIPPPHCRDKAPAARTPLTGTCEIARPRRNPENYANFVKRQGRTGRSRQPNGPIYNQ